MRSLDCKLTISNIQDWIKEYISSVKIDGVVVGISGGIDSAVTTTLCVNALGKENVIGLGLPCSSIPQDLNDAEELADMLGIKFLKIELSSVFDEFIKITSPIFDSSQIARVNLKPRLRMMTIYFASQSFGNLLVAGTSNRTELAIGYFTKYGDGGVDIEPIGGLYKCEVREFAKILNVPNQIIKKPPSAGLWEDQTDEGEIGISYNDLDEIIYRIDYNLSLDGLDKEIVNKVKHMMRSAEHKNKMPPVYKIIP